MDKLILHQQELLERVDKTFTNYKKSPKSRITISYVESRLETLEKWWSDFEQTHYELVGGVSREARAKLPYFSEDVYCQFEDVFIEYKTRLKEDMRNSQKSTERVSGCQESTTSVDVKLPQIQLPKFSGNYEEWQTFHDMFVSLIHTNKSLSAVQKLHYLKCSLYGEAEQLLKNLSTTDTNYEEGWKQLTRRYTNKRFNCNDVMKRLFGQRSLNSESANGIKQLVDTTSGCLKSLQNLEIDTNSWDAIINHLVLTKLDSESRKLWELQVSQSESEDLPTWNQLSKFLETRFRTLELLDGGRTTNKPPHRDFSSKQTPPVKKVFHSTTVNEKKSASNNEKVCVMCEGAHSIHQCKQFEKQSPQERSEFVQSNGLCFNCLSSNHSVRFCRQPMCCRRCGRRHHMMLHYERGQNQEPVTPESTSHIAEKTPGQNVHSSREPEKKVVAHFATENNESRVLLATAMIRVKASDGQSLVVRALIDQGSEVSFVTEETVQALGLKKSFVNGIVSGVGEGQTKTKSMVSVEVESLHKSDFSISVKAFVLKKLTSFLPSSDTVIPFWPMIQSLNLADPKYGSPGKIDMILGADVYGIIMSEGLLKHPSMRGPIAQNTQLGWILSGRVEGDESSVNRHVVSLHVTQLQEDQLLKQFWEIEREPDFIGKRMTKEELRCEEIFEKTTKRDEEGRYIVRLPFNSPDPECLKGKTKEIAIKRLKQLERRLYKNPKLEEEYKKVMGDYLQQNHMEVIREKQEIENNQVIYLPHHAVVREDKETTKVRIVYNASNKGDNNVSLNDSLLVGPKLQPDLRHTLMRWRRHEVCIVADLKQMYRQVKVDKQDADYQRILWRENEKTPIQHFRLLRLTFGTACAPYLAVKVLQQLAKDEEAKYPIASKITTRDYYMDDLLTGCENANEAVEIYEQMNALMRAGGFELQKWSSNCRELLNHINKESQKTDQSLIFKQNEMIKVLGIVWNKTTDNFEYQLNLPEKTENMTKRKVLSEIARLYDPMGWIAPVVMNAKVLIQDLWKSGLKWDDNLSNKITQEWFAFRDDLDNVRGMSIPRWLKTKREDHVELHAFADASQTGYAAAVYLKSKKINGEVVVNLVTAKTKVAPIEKEISIPRMELCAAQLAAKLIFEVAQIMDVAKENLYAWSDSTVVLAWIAGEPSRWTTFVSNRVSEILTMLDREQWNHVRTHENPADCASRGSLVVELKNNDLWWHGPKWLRETEKEYIEQNCKDFKTQEETRHVKTFTVTTPREEFIWIRFSSLMRMLRVLAYCKRLMNLKLEKEKRPKLSEIVTAEEREEILKICIRETQRLHFGEDFKTLQARGSVPRNSKLLTLSPFIDNCGMLRVGGRIHEADVEFEKRHPIILPSESHLSKLIVEDAHIKSLHGGPQLMLNLLRSKFWIMRARELAKRCYRQCVKCARYSRQSNNPFMGQIPEVRLKPIRPFKMSGVDFTGHINIKFSPGRGSKSYKGYICVLICMFTKAIHLEAVSDLTAQGFIAAFRRFVSRRGHCQTLFSDNGTNFVGASKELREMFNRCTSQVPEEIGKLLANDGTTWSFIPPHAPNFGGLWEAGVRSTKAHLKRVIGDSTLTFEELSTVLTQIEACLNSRPLSHMSSSPDDPMPLTPGHFLIGEPLIILPDEICEIKHINNLQRWKLTQKIMRDFWKKWSEEYLVTLQQRYKWNIKGNEPKIDDVVVLKDHNLPPAKWLLGKIVNIHSGKDNITRVVTIKTKNGLCKRPCNKLCFLPKSTRDNLD